MIALCFCSLAITSPAISQSLRRTPPPGFPDSIVPGRVVVRPLASSPHNEVARAGIIRNRDEMRTQGWMKSPPGRSAMLHGYFEEPRDRSRLRPAMADIVGQLRVAPFPLERTIFSKAELKGVMPAGGFVDGGWTGVARAMTVPQLGRVVLEEYDYVAAGSYIVVPEELVDDTVNGLPFQFAVWREETGRTWTEVRWFTANKEFRLFIEKPLRKSEQLFEELQQFVLAAN
ncbi:MAG: hypothetical protein IT518_11335 [Burkholderiales bacterium]|nr:hypothetical protein [Burkholderiales bacterium]